MSEGIAAPAGEDKSGASEAAVFTDCWWESADGLKLHYRDYGAPGGSDELPVICIPGLTRNARDFDRLAEALAASRRVICVDLRGRGMSEAARDSDSYNPMQYVADIAALFEQAAIGRAVFVGTSLGGIVTMLTAMVAPDRIAGAVLNDIGPVIEAAGLARIGEYVGQGRNYPTWMHAARALREAHGDTYPDWGIEDWIVHAKQLMVLGGNGRISFDYDMRIGDAFTNPPSGSTGQEISPDADLWPGFDALAGRPVLVVHGETSDILSGTVAREMVGRIPDVELVTIAGIGHTPTLNEPAVRAAIGRLLAKAR